MSHLLSRRLRCESLEARDLMAADPLPVLLVIADQQHFYFREYDHTRTSLLNAGVGVVVAATTTNPSTAHGGSGQGAGSGVVVPNIALANVDPADYSAIAFVGGWGSSMYQYAFNDPDLDGDTDNSYQNSFYNGDANLNDGQIAPTKVAVNNLINAFLADDKFVAGVCHGVTVLAWARVNGVSPLAGKTVAVPIKDGSPAMTFNGAFYGNGYVMGQRDMALANGAFPNNVSGQYGTPGTTTDDVVVDGRVITGGDDWSAAYFGTVIAQQVIANVPNQAPTDIALSANTVAENAAEGTAVGDFTTTDPDAVDSFTYTLVGGAGSADNGSFSMDGATLRAAASFNFEAKNAYTIRVRTTDAEGLFTEEAFAVAVTNVNETPLELTLSNAAVAEGEPAGTVVGTLSATDPDAGDALTYSLVAGDGSDDNAAFTIDEATLKTAAVFNREVKASYTVRVRAGDAAGLGTESVFVVTVADMNEKPTLNIDPTLLLPAVLKNAGNPAGVPVASLVENATDVETPETVGVALSKVYGIGGVWEYATSPAGPWNAVGAVSSTAAVLLARTDYVRFRPGRNLTGYAGLRFLAWDGQTGTAGQVVNPEADPGAFSADAETAWVPVGLPAKTFDASARRVLPGSREDFATPGVYAKSLLGFLPALFMPKTALGLAATGWTGNGEWQVRVNNTWQPLGAVSDAAPRMLNPTDVIRFSPAANWSGEATITYRARDVTTGATSGEALTAVATVTPVNDAPVLDTSLARVFTAAPQSVGALTAGAGDIDSTIAGIAITRISARGGRWEYRLSSTDTFKPFPPVSTRGALLLDPWAEIRFVPTTGTVIATLDYKAWDGSTGGLSGQRKLISGTAFSKATERATVTLV